MKLRNVPLGTRAIKRVRLPLVNAPVPYRNDAPELKAQREADRAAAFSSMPPGSDPGDFAFPDSIDVGIRKVNALERAIIFQGARDFAISRGSKDPGPSDPLYQLGLSVYLLAVACVDPDSDSRDPDPFFGFRGQPDTGAAEILESPHMGDSIQFLVEHQELWEDQCGARALTINPNEFFQIIADAAERDDARGFLDLRPGTQLNCFISTAKLAWNSLKDKSPGSLDSSDLTTKPSESAGEL